MSTSMQASPTLTFERFWKWLKDHPNCLVRAGTSDAWLYDHEDFHWRFDEEGPGQQVVQLLRGKSLVGELLLESSEVLYVQAAEDPDAERGHHLFQLIGGPKGEPYTLFQFLLAHGLEGEVAHQGALKH